MKHEQIRTPSYAEEQLEHLKEKKKQKIEVVTPQPIVPIPPDIPSGGGGGQTEICPYLKAVCIKERCMMWLADRTMPHGACAVVISAKAALNAARTLDRRSRP